MVSPVAWLISTRSARRRAGPRMTSTLPVATTRLSGPTVSKRSARTEISPLSVWMVIGACARPREGRGSNETHARSRIEAWARVIRVQKSPSEKEIHAIGPLFQRAGLIATAEVPEDVPDERQRAGDADEGGRGGPNRQRQRVDRRAGDVHMSDGGRHHRPQRIRRGGAQAPRLDQDESLGQRSEGGDDTGRVLVAEDAQYERDA